MTGDSDAEPPVEAPRSLRWLWWLVGLASLGLGILGVILPLLPTTPFILLAAFAFARSSTRWHNWLLAHSIFGPLIRNWQRYGAISRTAKRTSMLSILAILGISIALSVPTWIFGIQAIALSGSAVFILTRPNPP